MAALFTAEYVWLWTLAMTLALFPPVRQLIWILQVRRAEREREISDERRAALKRRAGATAALLSFVFSYFYMAQLLPSAS